MVSNQVQVQEAVECDTCGAVAVTEFEGDGGTIYPLCDTCDVHLRETLAGGYEECSLAFCECEAPRCGADGVQCTRCELEIRSWDNEPQYDWGEEREGDFPAEESESESDYDEEIIVGSNRWWADGIQAARDNFAYALLVGDGRW